MKEKIKPFFDLGNKYAERSDWKDFALVKFCLFAMGIFMGIHVNPKDKKVVGASAIIVFIATYIPLMMKVFKIIKETDI